MESLKKTDISVLLPVYNGERYVKAAIESIIGQSFQNFELIIIDDGSTDNSVSVIQSFSDERILFIKNHSNIGLVATLNNALSLAKGEFIARMDGDDISVPSRLQKQFDYLKSNPTIGLCGSQLSTIGEGEVYSYPEWNEDIQFRFLTYNAIAHPAVMFRKQLLLDYDLKYEAIYYPAEDYMLWVKLAAVTSFYNFQEPLLKYRLHHASISKTLPNKQNAKVNQIRAYFLLHSIGLWSLEFEKLLKNIFNGDSNFDMDELKKVARLADLCIEYNTKFDSEKFKKYISNCFYEACLQTKAPKLRLLTLYIKKDLHVSLKRMVRLILKQI